MKIDSYTFGFISIDGRGYSNDIIIYPDGTINNRWWRKEGHRLGIEDLDRLPHMKPEVVVIGTGASGLMKVPDETLQHLKTICEQIVIDTTSNAVRKFNFFSQSKKVAGLFHLTC
jgi:hypothetical protein